MDTPRHPIHYDDRLLDCEEALESSFLAMMDDAYDSGWKATEVAIALTSLADNLILKLMANEETSRQIAASKRTLQ